MTQIDQSWNSSEPSSKQTFRSARNVASRAPTLYICTLTLWPSLWLQVTQIRTHLRFIKTNLVISFLVHWAIFGWLVELGLNAILTPKVISWRSVTHMCFLAFSNQHVYNFSCQSHRLLFSHASAEVRGEKTPERKFASTGANSQPPVESITLTTEPPGQSPLGNKCGF